MGNYKKDPEPKLRVKVSLGVLWGINLFVSRLYPQYRLYKLLE